MTITTLRGSRRGGIATLLAIPTILLTLAACAPAAGGDGSDGGAGGGTDTVTSEKSELTQWKLDYAVCMRAEGVDMPDPESADQGGATSAIGPGADQDAAAAAGAKCEAELGPMPPPSVTENAAADEAMLERVTKSAECYRENGYDMPDPVAGQQPQFPQDAPEEIVQECGGVAAPFVVQE